MIVSVSFESAPLMSVMTRSPLTIQRSFPRGDDGQRHIVAVAADVADLGVEQTAEDVEDRSAFRQAVERADDGIDAVVNNDRVVLAIPATRKPLTDRLARSDSLGPRRSNDRIGCRRRAVDGDRQGAGQADLAGGRIDARPTWLHRRGRFEPQRAPAVFTCPPTRPRRRRSRV